MDFFKTRKRFPKVRRRKQKKESRIPKNKKRCQTDPRDISCVVRLRRWDHRHARERITCPESGMGQQKIQFKEMMGTRTPQWQCGDQRPFSFHYLNTFKLSRILEVWSNTREVSCGGRTPGKAHVKNLFSAHSEQTRSSK